jgi:hypothetical protein
VSGNTGVPACGPEDLPHRLHASNHAGSPVTVGVVECPVAQFASCVLSTELPQPIAASSGSWHVRFVPKLRSTEEGQVCLAVGLGWEAGIRRLSSDARMRVAQRRKTCRAASERASGIRANEVGWEAGIRTPITWSRATCPTVERPPSSTRNGITPFRQIQSRLSARQENSILLAGSRQQQASPKKEKRPGRAMAPGR